MIYICSKFFCKFNEKYLWIKRGIILWSYLSNPNYLKKIKHCCSALISFSHSTTEVWRQEIKMCPAVWESGHVLSVLENSLKHASPALGTNNFNSRDKSIRFLIGWPRSDLSPRSGSYRRWLPMSSWPLCSPFTEVCSHPAECASFPILTGLYLLCRAGFFFYFKKKNAKAHYLLHLFFPFPFFMTRRTQKDLLEGIFSNLLVVGRQ